MGRTSNNRVIVARDLYCCLLPQFEALHTCRLGFPILGIYPTVECNEWIQYTLQWIYTVMTFTWLCPKNLFNLILWPKQFFIKLVCQRKKLNIKNNELWFTSDRCRFLDVWGGLGSRKVSDVSWVNCSNTSPGKDRLCFTSKASLLLLLTESPLRITVWQGKPLLDKPFFIGKSARFVENEELVFDTVLLFSWVAPFTGTWNDNGNFSLLWCSSRQLVLHTVVSSSLIWSEKSFSTVQKRKTLSWVVYNF